MDDKLVTRSSNNKVFCSGHTQEGVGARHKDHSHPAGGGGYLGVCTDYGVSEKKFSDPRLDELKDMGVGGFWRALAFEIGFDAFVVVWSSLSSKAARSDEGHRVYVPRYNSFIRYQRNRLIISLHESGLSVRDIKRKVVKELTVDVSEAHIYRVISQNRRK